jgi:hypothetical protein
VNTRALPIVAVLALAVGISACSETSTTTSATTTSAKATSSTASHPKPETKKTKGDRIQSCLEDVGYDIERPNATMMRVKSPAGRMDAVILRFKSAGAARNDAAEGVADGLTSVAFGRYTVNYYNKADDPSSSESKVITDCVA